MTDLSRIRPEETEPSNIEAEQQLLGAVLLNNEIYNLVSDVLAGDVFADPVHQRVWNWISQRVRSGHLASPVSGRLVFEADEGMAQLGGPKYLARMAAVSCSSVAARDFAYLILDAHQRRNALRSLNEARQALLTGQDVSVAQGIVEAASAALLASERQRPSTPFSEAAARSLDQTFAAYHGRAQGLTSGIGDYDELTGGMMPGDMIVIGGAPSMGKTSLAQAIVYGVAKQTDERGRPCKGVAVVSLEMSDESLAQRLLSAESGVPYFLLRNGSMTEEQAKKLVEAAQKMPNLPIEIVGSHVRDIGSIFAVCKRIQSHWARTAHPLSLLVVDYLQLVRSPAKDRFQMVAEVSMGLKGLAKMLGIPVVALSQISRDVGNRDDKRPKLSDLRESAQIEQDADVVMFTHRDFYYLQREGPPRGKDGKIKDGALIDHEEALRASKNRMDLILAKHRSGAIGERQIGCDITTNRFWSLGDAGAAKDFA